ncbi:hypothetical protein KY366_03440 [Candidatus Woesearchaeota archaeon]|nr:hypothetical protein [Candidatus Woesearchaeota archaeon]
MEQHDNTELPLDEKTRIITVQMNKVRGLSRGEVLMLENPSVYLHEKDISFIAQLGIYAGILDNCIDQETGLVRGIGIDHSKFFAVIDAPGNFGPVIEEYFSRGKQNYPQGMLVGIDTKMHVGQGEVMETLRPYGKALCDLVKFYIREHRTASP